MYSSSFPGSPRGPTCQGSRIRIVLCGGGVISAAISYYLTVLSKELKITIEVTIVEKGAIACSSSGKAGGFLALDWCKGLPIDELAQKSFSLHADLAKTLNGAEKYGYRRGKKTFIIIYLLYLVETLEIYADDELEVGKNIELSENLNWLDQKLISNMTTIGTSSTTAQVDSYRFTTTLVNEAKLQGAKVLQGEVIGFSFDSENPKIINGVKLEDGRILECEYAVIAMGAWSASLNSWFKYEIPPDSDIDIELPITGSRAHSVIFQPPEKILAENPISAHALFAKAIIKGSAKELELYPRSNGHLYVCGEGDGVALPYSADLIKPNLSSTKNLIRFAQTLVPILSEYEIIREQACYLPYSETGSPIIGHLPFFENLLVATGHSCWGMLNAPATGLSIAQLILTGRSSIVDLTPFGLE